MLFSPGFSGGFQLMRDYDFPFVLQINFTATSTVPVSVRGIQMFTRDARFFYRYETLGFIDFRGDDAFFLCKNNQQQSLQVVVVAGNGKPIAECNLLDSFPEQCTAACDIQSYKISSNDYFLFATKNWVRTNEVLLLGMRLHNLNYYLPKRSAVLDTLVCDSRILMLIKTANGVTVFVFRYDGSAVLVTREDLDAPGRNLFLLLRTGTNTVEVLGASGEYVFEVKEWERLTALRIQR